MPDMRPQVFTHSVSEHLKNGHSKGPNIDGIGVLYALKQLGCHVGDSAALRGSEMVGTIKSASARPSRSWVLARVVELAGATKVADANVSVSFDENIARLQIAVYYCRPMEMFKTCELQLVEYEYHRLRNIEKCTISAA